jgi:hypothetical protein
MVRRSRAMWGRLPRRARVLAPVAVVLVAAAIAVPLALAGSAAGGPCDGADHTSYACWGKHFESVIEEKGGKAALAELALLVKNDGWVMSNCHPLAHQIGNSALVFYGTVKKAINNGDGTCWSGYIHGVYEKYMAQFDDAELFDEVKTLCERDPDDPYAFDYYNCLHGIGHGVTIRFKNDVFKGLPYCDVFEEDWERTNCATGAFMQNIVVDRTMHQSVRLDPDDPVYPCNAVEDKWKSACYLGQTSYILRQLDYDYAKGFEVCDSIEEDYISTCYVSMGRDISGNSHREAAKVLERCSLGDPDFQEWCFIGATRNAVFHDHGTTNADALCAIVPERYRPRCESARDSAAESL